MKQPNDVFNDFQARMSELLKNSPAKHVERNAGRTAKAVDAPAVLSVGLKTLYSVVALLGNKEEVARWIYRNRSRTPKFARRVAGFAVNF